MRIEQLLNTDSNVDLGDHCLQLQPESPSGAVSHGKIDLENDAVYFCGDSSPSSFSGHLSGCLDDEEIIEYIRRSNRALYDRLWRSGQNQNAKPVTSVITDHQNFRDGAADDAPPYNVTIRRNSNLVATPDASERPSVRRSSWTALPSSPSSMTSPDSCGRDVYSTLSSKEPTLLPAAQASRSENELQQDLYLLQQRRYIQSLLLNEHILVLQKVPPSEAKVRSRSCDHPLCRYRRGIAPGAYRLSLESRRMLEKSTATADKYYSPKDEDSGKYLKVRSSNSRGFYCLTCIEDLFSGVGMLDDDYTIFSSASQAFKLPRSLTSSLMSLDGSSDELRSLVLGAAEKLLPSTHRADEARVRLIANLATDHTQHPTSDRLAQSPSHNDSEDLVDTEFPSNSDGAILLRDAKRQETEATLFLLYQNAYRQEARRLSQPFSDDELPSLKILRPSDLPPRKEQYKKQGLGLGDWRLWRSSLLASHLQEQQSGSINLDMKEGENHRLAPVERFCYCRELDDLEGMVWCSAEFCLIGRVHLRCSGLPRLPTEGETWFCTECSTLFGNGTFDPALTPTSELDVECTRVLRSNVRGPSKFADRHEAGNVASDELSTEEASLPVSDDEVMDPTYVLPMTPRRQSKNAVGMNFTPYEFLDGASECKPKVRSTITNEAASTENTAPATPKSIKCEAKSPKRRVTCTKRTSTLTLQDPDEPSTPIKRLKRTLSPPPPLTPPSRHVKTSFGHVAPFIFAETRTSAAALSNPQIVALEKWKSIHLYSPLTEMIESSRPESVASASPSKNSREASTASTIAPNIATLEVGGTVINLPSVNGKKLSQVLSEVDAVVQNELRKQGSTGWEQGVHGREEAVKAGKARGSRVDEQNGLTSPKVANDIRRRISKSFSGSKEAK